MLTVALLALTVLMWGSSPIIEKIGLTGKIDPITAVSIRSFAIAVVLIVFLTFSGRIKEVLSVDPKTLIIFSVSGIMAGLLGMITYFWILKLNPTSKIVPLAATYPLVTALLSVLILKEGVTPGRLLGTLLIVAGVWLVR